MQCPHCGRLALLPVPTIEHRDDCSNFRVTFLRDANLPTVLKRLVDAGADVVQVVKDTGFPSIGWTVDYYHTEEVDPGELYT